MISSSQKKNASSSLSSSVRVRLVSVSGLFFDPPPYREQRAIIIKECTCGSSIFKRERERERPKKKFQKKKKSSFFFRALERECYNAKTYTHTHIIYFLNKKMNNNSNNPGEKQAEIYTYEAPWLIYACNWSVRFVISVVISIIVSPR